MISEVLSQTTIIKRWWWSKRAQYNVGLLVAGLLAFVIYCIIAKITTLQYDQSEETFFWLIPLTIVYLMMMFIANVFYTLGSVIDITFNKSNDQQFREQLFALGYWFSFSLPTLLILGVMIGVLIWGK